jgi:hypothetical protein
MSTLRNDLLASLTHERDQAHFDLAHDIINPATTLLEYSGMLRASYRLRDDRLVPDCLDAIDKAIRALIDFRHAHARKIEGVVAILPVASASPVTEG